MGLVIGMDEAGYGPNLGPLVITATAWRVPGAPGNADFWTALEGTVSRSATKEPGRIHVGDSKEVYSPARGIQSLERSVQAIFGLTAHDCSSYRNLCHWLMQQGHSVAGFDGWPESLNRPVAVSDASMDARQDSGASSPTLFLDVEPWFCQSDLELPVDTDPTENAEISDRLRSEMAKAGIQLVGIRSDVVLTERFNSVSEYYQSKGAALSRFAMGLLRSLWEPDLPDATLIIGDKHGGRSRYDELIAEQLDGQMVLRLGEGRQRSSYRVGASEIHFQTRAEEHFPVAVASMVCKYIRELSMELFNSFWQEQLPGLKPTKGYPVDARRFRNEIATVQARLGIPDSTLWRKR